MTQPTFDGSRAAEFTCPPEGWYVWEVKSAEAKKGPKGWRISLLIEVCEGEFAGYQTYDNIMLDGRGAGIGRKKAAAFGVKFIQDQPVEAKDFEGRRAKGYGSPREYKGYTNLNINIDTGTHCGYDPIGEPTVDPGDQPGGDYDFDDIPF